MDINTGIRNTYTKEAVWIERVREALNSTRSNAEWCREQDIHYSSFRAWKLRLKRRGLLPRLVEQAEGFVPATVGEDPACYTLCSSLTTYPIHFAAMPIEGVSFDQLYWRIRTSFSRDPACGDLFLFLRQDRTTVYALRYCGSGFRFTRSCLDKGTLPWPGSVTAEGVSNLTRAQLRALLELVAA